jgi:hypothetical protein
MGYPSESIVQTDLYSCNDICISTLKIKLERGHLEYWLFAVELSQKFEEETTMILPKPFEHDKYQRVEFNKKITSSGFLKNFNIFSSEFMHAYYLISGSLIRSFNSIPAGNEKWLSVRKNKAYLCLPKKSIDHSINNLDLVQEEVISEANTALRISGIFENMLIYNNRTKKIDPQK